MSLIRSDRHVFMASLGWVREQHVYGIAPSINRFSPERTGLTINPLLDVAWCVLESSYHDAVLRYLAYLLAWK